MALHDGLSRLLLRDERLEHATLQQWLQHTRIPDSLRQFVLGSVLPAAGAAAPLLPQPEPLPASLAAMLLPPPPQPELMEAPPAQPVDGVGKSC